MKHSNTNAAGVDWLILLGAGQMCIAENLLSDFLI